jgi:hypothetical protein
MYSFYYSSETSAAILLVALPESAIGSVSLTTPVILLTLSSESLREAFSAIIATIEPIEPVESARVIDSDTIAEVPVSPVSVSVREMVSMTSADVISAEFEESDSAEASAISATSDPMVLDESARDNASMLVAVDPVSPVSDVFKEIVSATVSG